MQFHRKFVLRVETGNLLRHLCFVETKSWWPLISVQGNKLSPISWARAGPHLGGEHDGPGDLEHGVGPRGLRPAGAHQGQQIGGAQQRDQDHQRLGISEDVRRISGIFNFNVGDCFAKLCMNMKVSQVSHHLSFPELIWNWTHWLNLSNEPTSCLPQNTDWQKVNRLKYLCCLEISPIVVQRNPLTKFCYNYLG